MLIAPQVPHFHDGFTRFSSVDSILPSRRSSESSTHSATTTLGLRLPVLVPPRDSYACDTGEDCFHRPGRCPPVRLRRGAGVFGRGGTSRDNLTSRDACGMAEPVTATLQ